MKKQRLFAIAGILLLVVLASVVYVYRDGFLLASAMTQNQSRPDFMNDISWNDESSDLLIKERFPLGSAEVDLMNVLRATEFAIFPADQTAELRLRKLPCNELLEVHWKADAKGKLLQVEGAASEAGCL
jgi:hypothetical protein